MPSRDADALRTLSLTSARWHAVLDSAQDAIISITPAGDVTLFSAGAERMFGYAADEVVGCNVAMLMPSPYREEHDEYLARYAATGEARAIGRVRQVRARRKNGETFPIELSVSEAAVGEDHLFNAIIRDVSERERAAFDRRELARRLQQGERLADIGAVTARIVHDFGNPLAGLLMTANQMLRRMEREPAQLATALRPQVDRLLDTARRLDLLMHDFKDFAREQRLDLHPVSLTPFLEDVVHGWRPEAESRDVALRLDGPSDVTVALDRSKCRRLFDNLVKNALEALDHGPGAVEIEAARVDAERVRVSVLDDGPGVPPGIDVFALFETTKPHGTGLGLPICRQIAVAHGGNLAFAPREPRGTAFHVVLPLGGPGMLRPPL